MGQVNLFLDKNDMVRKDVDSLEFKAWEKNVSSPCLYREGYFVWWYNYILVQLFIVLKVFFVVYKLIIKRNKKERKNVNVLQEPKCCKPFEQ